MLKRVLLTCALFLLITSTTSAEEVTEGQTRITLPDTSSYSKVQRELLQIERRRSAAIAAHDLKWLAASLTKWPPSPAACGQRL